MVEELDTTTSCEVAESADPPETEPPAAEETVVPEAGEADVVPAAEETEAGEPDGVPEADGIPETAEVRSARAAAREAARATKESLITQAELVAVMSPPNTAAAEMKALLEQWKHAGRTSKATDDALWARFNLAQDQLFTRLDLLRQQRQAAAAEATRAKLSLIATAEEVATRADLRQAGETMAALMTEWKAIPPAPGDKDLWLKFKAARDQVFARRNEERSKAESGHSEAAAAKRALIAKAEALIGAADLRQATAELHELDAAFAAAGYAGRSLNAELGEAYREVRRRFYSWLRGEPSRRQASGEQPVYGRRVRLVNEIQRVREEIDQAEAALKSANPAGAKRSHGTTITLTLGQSGTYSGTAADAMRAKIKLADLERQLARLDATLGPGAP